MAKYSRSFIQNINDRRSWFRKKNALLNLINNQTDIEKIYLYAKDPYEAKYQYLINKGEKVSPKHYDDPKAFIEYSNDMQDFYKNIEEHNLCKKREVLIVFDDIIDDMIANKKLNPIVTELFLWGRKLNISIDFITQSCFEVPKEDLIFLLWKFETKGNLSKLH